MPYSCPRESADSWISSTTMRASIQKPVDARNHRYSPAIGESPEIPPQNPSCKSDVTVPSSHNSQQVHKDQDARAKIVSESLLSDRGINLLSYLRKKVCRLLRTRKLITSAYHPQCDRMNRTLKSMLCKHAAKFEEQWDTYLSGVL